MNVTKICVYPIFPTGIEKYNVKQKTILTVDSVISKRLKSKVSNHHKQKSREFYIKKTNVFKIIAYI